MGRRLVEHKSRAENTREITRVQDSFSGEYSDLPASEIPKKGVSELINACAWGEVIDARDGVKQVPTYQISSVLVKHTLSIATESMTKAGSTITIGAVSPTHLFTSDDQYRDLVWSDGTYDHITTVTDTKHLIVDNSNAITGFTTATLVMHVWGQIYSVKNAAFVFQADDIFYLLDSTGTIYQFYACGTTLPGRSATKFYELDTYVIAFNANGIYKLDMTKGRTSTYWYWRCNYDPVTNYIANSTTTAGMRYRRYLYTLTRQGGNDCLNYDRGTNTLQQEIGSNLLNSSAIDYAKVVSNSPLIPVGPSATVYGKLTCGTSVLPSAVSGAKYFFNITVNSVTKTVQLDLPSTATANDVVSALNSQLDTLYSEYVYCEYVSTGFVFHAYEPGATIGYLTSPTALTGWTDISATIKGTAASGASTSTPTYFTYAQLYNPTCSAWNKTATHLSVYSTKDLSELSGEVSDPNAYAWVTDVPVMTAGRGTWHDTTLTLSSGVTWPEARVGSELTIVGTKSGVPYAVNTSISSYTSSTVVEVAADDDAYALDNENVSVFLGSLCGIVGTTSLWGTTLTITKATGLLSTLQTAEHWDPCAWYASASLLSVGDPIFGDDGNVYYVTSATSDSTTVTYTIDSHGNTAPERTMAFACLPNNLTTYSSGGSHVGYTSIRDRVDDETLSARIGTLGLKTRFFRALPSSNIGTIVPGFAFVATGNQYYWNSLPQGYKYFLGNCHPVFQQDKIDSSITAFSGHDNSVAVYTKYTTSKVTTNLNITYTDESNGLSLTSLPAAVTIDSRTGVDDWRHIVSIALGTVAVVCSDRGLRIFDGNSYGQNLLYKMIHNKIRALNSFVVCYDQRYGVLIIGSTTSSHLYYDKMYVRGIRTDAYQGASDFEDVPFSTHGVQWMEHANRATWLNRLARTCTLEQDLTTDTAVSGTPDIAWSVRTGADKGDAEHYWLTHLESHVYISDRANDTDTPSCTIACTVYRDNTVLVTTTRQLIRDSVTGLYDEDVVFDVKAHGHKISYLFEFSNAEIRLNGLQHYYLAADKAGSQETRLTYENTLQLDMSQPVLWLTRSERGTNDATGQKLGTYLTVERITGPDSRDYSGWRVVSMGGYISTNLAATVGEDWLFSSYVQNFGTISAVLIQTGTTGWKIYGNGTNTLYITHNSVTKYSASTGSAAGWHHLLVTHSGSTGFVAYLDGVALTPVDNTAVAGSSWSSTETTYIAHRQYGTRLYNALTYSADTWSYYRTDVLAGGDRTEALQ